MRWFVTALLCCPLASAAQQIGQNAQPGFSGAATFSTGAQLVVETVAVTDRQGKPIEGLTAKDFTVTENGVPQEIRVFEYQKLPETAAGTPAARSDSEPIRIYEKLAACKSRLKRPGTH